jgi:hypothetical protein
MISRTKPEMAFLFKYWLALILFVPAIATIKDVMAYPVDIVIVVGFALSGFFCLTAAEVQAHEEILKYRRFLFWKQIPYAQIHQCKDSRIPGLGFIRLAQFVPPWGKIYFVTMRPAFSGNPRELVSFINSRRAGIETAPTDDEGVPAHMYRNARFCLLMGFLGVTSSFMAAYLNPGFAQTVSWDRFPRWYAVFMNLWDRAFSWPWALVTIMVLIAILFWFRLKGRAWLTAWILGALLGSLVVRAIH